MTTDIESQTRELLSVTVEDEKKNVTYRWLSRSMGYSVNTAKQLMESYLSTVGKGKVHGTYYLARQDPQTGSQAVTLVSQEYIDDAKKDPTVLGYHIYSLEPSPVKDLAILSASNSEASRLQKGKDINLYRIVRNTEVIVSKSNTRSAVSASSTASSTTAVKSTGQQAKQSAASTSSSTTTITSISSGAATPATSNDSKAKPAPAAGKPSMMSFFGKAASNVPKAAPPATASAKPAAQKRKADSMMSSSSNNYSHAAKEQENDSDEEVDSEEERDRRLALSSRLDQDQGDVLKADKKTEVTTASVDMEAIKKRQRSARLLVVDDDDDDDEAEEEDGHGPHKANCDDEDEEESVEKMSKEARIALNKEKEAQRLALENMMLMDDSATGAGGVEDEDSPMIDVEALDVPPSKESLASVADSPVGETYTNGKGQLVRRRRGVRAVTKRKTSRNERGYMVTEDVVVMEPFSEDEIVPTEAPAPVRAAEPVRAKADSVTAAVGAGASGVVKKKAGSGNQSLLNFFKKQN